MNVVHKALTEEMYPWIREHLNPVFCEDTRGVLSVNEETGEVLAASVMDQWTPNSCQIHVVIKNPLAIRHGFIHETFTYIYEDCGRKKVFGLTPANNDDAIRFNQHVGFREIARLPEAFAEGVDYIVYQMDKEDSRWHQPRRAVA